MGVSDAPVVELVEGNGVLSLDELDASLSSERDGMSRAAGALRADLSDAAGRADRLMAAPVEPDEVGEPIPHLPRTPFVALEPGAAGLGGFLGDRLRDCRRGGAGSGDWAHDECRGRLSRRLSRPVDRVDRVGGRSFA